VQKHERISTATGRQHGHVWCADIGTTGDGCANAHPFCRPELGSGSLITDVLRIIVEKVRLADGYLPGTTITLETALANNDIQVIGEEWAGRSPVGQGRGGGKVASLGDTVKGAEGWWVPEYVIKGDPAKGIKPLAPDLRSVSDLKQYKDVFKDPENPSKGRFLNSPIGWTSEVVNKQKLSAYGLQDDYTNFRSGSVRRWMPRSVLRSAGQTGAVLLLVADAVAGQIQTGATGRATV
jgi:ABC-type proline/glycine betaine transport system substrate-binding protein